MTVTIENTYTQSGSTTDYGFTFPYLDQPDIKVSLDGVAHTNFRLLNATTVQFVNNTTDNTPTAPPAGTAIRIYRETAYTNPKATFYPGSAIRAGDLNDNTLQNLYVTQEANDKVDKAWLTGDPTIISTESWYTTDDTKIATTKAIENRIDTKIDTALTTDVVGGQSVTVTDNSPSSGKITIAVTDASIGTTQLAADAVDGTKIANDSINSEHYVAGSIDTEHIADGQVTHAKLSNDCIDGDNIQDDVINSEHYAAGSIDEEHIATGAVTHDKLGADCIDGDNIQNDVINSEHYAAGSIDHEHLANDIIDGDNIQDDVINSEHIAAGAVDLEHMSANSVDSDQYVDGSIDRVHLSADIIDATKIEDDAVTTDHIQDAELVTLAGMPSATASILADSTALTANTSELNILDNKTFRSSGDGSLTTTSDTEIPSSKVIAAHVSSTILATGGFISINNEVSFPTTANQPANGVIVSISDAAGTVINGSGTSTTGRTTDGTPATVTINNFPSSLHGETLATGVGMLVTSTGSSNIYNYHKILAAEADVKQLSDDINDFNARYRVAGSAPGSNNDAGDMYFDTSANKMKVYNGTTNAWDDVASVGNFYINTLSSSSGTGGGNANFATGVYRFTLSNPPTMAQQLIVSVNGVIQKPNAGSSQPSEGFAIDGNDIIFSTAPAAGSDYFIVTQGSSVSIGTPSDNTVSTAKIQNLAVNDAKIANNTIEEVSLKISNTPSDGKFLQYKDSSDKLTWSSVDLSSKAGLAADQTFSGTNSFSGNTNLHGGSISFSNSTSTSALTWTKADNELRFEDNVKLEVGTGGDLTIKHDGTNSSIVNTTGTLDIQNANSLLNLTSSGVDINSTGNIILRGGSPVRIEAVSGASGGQIDLREGTTGGTNIVSLKAPATIANDYTLTLPNAAPAANGQVLSATTAGAASWTTISAAPEITGTVTGTLPDGKPVVIKTDGTLLEAKISGPEHGTAQEPTGGALGEVAVASMRQDRIVVVWNSTGSATHGANACIGKINPTTKTITFGSASQPPQSGHLTYFQYPEVFVFDSSSFGEMVIVSWWHSNNSATYMTVLVGPTGDSTTAPTWSSSDYSTSAGNSKFGRSMTRLGDRLIYSYISGTTGYLKAYTVGNGSFTTGGSAVSYGTYVNNAKIASANSGAGLVVYDRATQKEFNYRRFTVSGTTITLGTNQEETSQNQVSDTSSWVTPDYDYISITPKPITSDGANVFGVLFRQDTNIKAVLISTTSSQNNASSFSTVASSQGDLYTPYCHACFDSDNKFVVYWHIGGNTNAVKSSYASLSGSGNANSWTIGSWSTPENRSTHGSNGMHATPLWMTQSTGAIVFLYNDGNDSNTGKAHVRTGLVTNITADNYIGYSNGAFTNGQTGTVKVVGNVATGLSSLTPGSKYYLQNDGTLSTTAASPSVVAGIALTSSTLLIK